MYCENCGTPVPDGAKFCPQCRAPIEQQYQTPQQETQRYQTQQQYEQGYSPTNDVSETVTDKPKSNHMPVIIAAVACSVVVVVGIILFFALSLGKNGTKQEQELANQDIATDIQEELQDGAEDAQAAVSQQDTADQSETSSGEEIDYDKLAEAIARVQSESEDDSSDADQSESNGTTINNYYYYGSNSNASQNDGYYSQAGDNTYLWPTDSQYISRSDRSGLSKDTVAAIRNEIYARHGYAFQTDRWSSYFARKTWYHRDSSCTESTVNSRLSAVEKANVDTIVAYEADKGWR